MELSALETFCAVATEQSVTRVASVSGGERPDGIGQRNWEVIELNSYHAILACVMAGTSFALCPRSVLGRQRPAVDLRTRHIASVGNWLIARTGYWGSAYEELRRAVSAQRGFASGGASEWASVDARQRL
jgi:DNA-binding transcriptional LysR family regulator